MLLNIHSSFKLFADEASLDIIVDDPTDATSQLEDDLRKHTLIG